jgi:RND family efflux transporter MFP subunit
MAPNDSEARSPETGAEGTQAARSETVQSEAVQSEARPQQSRRTTSFLVGAVLLGLAISIAVEIHSRADAEAELVKTTRQSAIPIVDVIRPERGRPDEQLTLPGNTMAFIDTPIYARTSGYLKKWYFDIGAHVKQGDLLAEIDTPEVDQQLRQARADLATAEANVRLAGITAKRNVDLMKTNSVSQQVRDNAVGALDADEAIVHSREADVARLQQLQSYEKVFAPFDGVVTARRIDIGALIDAGAASPTSELFHMAALNTLRIYVAVPEVYAAAARTDSPVTVTFEEYPGETFPGTVKRNSNAIDAASRTLNVEVDVDNGGGKIMPGAYGFVHFSMASQAANFTIPANALLFRREGLQVGIVRDGKALLVSVKIGRDYGDKVEIVSGLGPDDRVIVDPSDSLVSGTPVQAGEHG